MKHKTRKASRSKPGPKDVNSYIQAAPASAQPMLRQLRRAIMESAPDATEKISYGMPTYEYRGNLANFAIYEKHIGLYGVVHEDKPVDPEARPYLESRSTLRFPIDRPLPVALVKRVVAARVRENETSADARK